MGNELRRVRAEDGRLLGVAEWGDPAGRPVLALHGTPGSRLNRPPGEAALREAGLRLVTYDRPGYGASDRQLGRRIVDCVPDVEAVADALDIGRFVVSGVSGGAPHALAVAALLGDRVVTTECSVGPAPVAVFGAEWTRGMDEENVREFGWAMQGEETLHRELSQQAASDLARMAADPSKVFSDDWEFEEADRAVLARTDIQQMLGEAWREAFHNGVWGWVDDDLALIGPWGFEVSQISSPVVVRYGEHDVMVPAAHGRWLAANVPNATVLVDHQAGHMKEPQTRVQELADLAASLG